MLSAADEDGAPRIVPVYRNGRLEHFADIRGFINPFPDAASGADSAPGPRPIAPQGSGARSFNLDACMAMPDGVQR